jgi:hypothetical protein
LVRSLESWRSRNGSIPGSGTISQTRAMTVSAVRNVSASRRGADVGWRMSAAWPDGADKAPVPVAAILDHGGATLPRCWARVVRRVLTPAARGLAAGSGTRAVSTPAAFALGPKPTRLALGEARTDPQLITRAAAAVGTATRVE